MNDVMFIEYFMFLKANCYLRAKPLTALNVEECDTSGDAKSAVAGNKKVLLGGEMLWCWGMCSNLRGVVCGELVT